MVQFQVYCSEVALNYIEMEAVIILIVGKNCLVVIFKWLVVTESR